MRTPRSILHRKISPAFSESEIEFLTQVTNHIALAVENALAYGEIADLKDRLSLEKVYLENELRTEFNFAATSGDCGAKRLAQIDG